VASTAATTGKTRKQIVYGNQGQSPCQRPARSPRICAGREAIVVGGSKSVRRGGGSLHRPPRSGASGPDLGRDEVRGGRQRQDLAPCCCWWTTLATGRRRGRERGYRSSAWRDGGGGGGGCGRRCDRSRRRRVEEEKRGWLAL
jgi:hypothetical protein